jgi:hypothetical protein
LKEDPTVLSTEQLWVVVYASVNLVRTRWEVVAATVQVALLNSGRQLWHTEALGMLPEHDLHSSMERQTPSDRARNTAVFAPKPGPGVLDVTLEDLAALVELGQLSFRFSQSGFELSSVLLPKLAQRRGHIPLPSLFVWTLKECPNIPEG